MKIKGHDGEFYFKALLKNEFGRGWTLSQSYFSSKEEADNCLATWNQGIKIPTPAIWPVEVMDNGPIYVPSKEELEEEA